MRLKVNTRLQAVVAVKTCLAKYRDEIMETLESEIRGSFEKRLSVLGLSSSSRRGSRISTIMDQPHPVQKAIADLS